jgi:hypothetical protein
LINYLLIVELLLIFAVREGFEVGKPRIFKRNHARGKATYPIAHLIARAERMIRHKFTTCTIQQYLGLGPS